MADLAENARAETLRVVALVAALAVAFALVPRFTRGLERRDSGPAPTFTAKVVANPERADERDLALGALAGRPVLLDFWATWCGPCQAELPIVNGIANRYRDRGLAVVGVNTSDREGLAAEWVRRRGLTFPVVYDDGNAIAAQYGVESLPTLVLISKEGNIVAVRRGVTSDAELERLVRQVL